MRKHGVTFDVFDVVVTPFPFVDLKTERKRPALILSSLAGFGAPTAVAVTAMITTGRRSDWPFDVPVVDLASAGLRHPCKVRMKISTIDFQIIERKIGRLSEADQRAVAEALRQLFPQPHSTNR